MKTSLFLRKWNPRQAAQEPQEHQSGPLSKPPAFSSLIIQLPADTPAFTQQNLAYTLQLRGYQAFEPEENLRSNPRYDAIPILREVVYRIRTSKDIIDVNAYRTNPKEPAPNSAHAKILASTPKFPGTVIELPTDLVLLPAPTQADFQTDLMAPLYLPIKIFRERPRLTILALGTLLLNAYFRPDPDHPSIHTYQAQAAAFLIDACTCVKTILDPA